MFDPSTRPRVFALPPGADFTRGLKLGLTERLAGAPPERLSEVEIYVNAQRMQTRLKRLFDGRTATLLPRIHLVSDLALDLSACSWPLPASPLGRRLELAQLVRALLDREPGLAARSAAFDLADSLAMLLAEMHDEGVPPDRLAALDISDQSGHWDRSLRFLGIAAPFFAADGGARPSIEARQSAVVDALCARWAEAPPDHPVLVAGSTGSRGSTARFMAAVARLPQGALVLPGFDTDLPAETWRQIAADAEAEDHPQARYARLLSRLGIDPAEVVPWTRAVSPPVPARSRLVSLALRPAPVTHQWLDEGPALDDVAGATEGLTLVEAASPREEALAIAVRLRGAVEAGQIAALITPDRTLARQVTAALDRWRIEPDDSAGRPASQTVPGRLLRQVANQMGRPLTSEALLALLKHPLTHAGGEGRGRHLEASRSFELFLRKARRPQVDAATITSWHSKLDDDTWREAWTAWLRGLVAALAQGPERPLSDHLAHHVQVAELLVAGPGGTGAALWEREAGTRLAALVVGLTREAAQGGRLSVFDYATLFSSILERIEVREARRPRPDVMIWGTQETRVQSVDLVILGGLNEGIWPKRAAPDPWLNRALRQRAGLPSPDVPIGLSAHDFQQAVLAREVMLCRAVRDDEAQTVASRWLFRLTTLLDGVSGDGRACLEAMRQRGDAWLQTVREMERPASPVPPAPRPAPAPPVEARPRQINVTDVEKLIRDPYAIYAKSVLRVEPLDPLRPAPDALLRGTVVHRIFERFLTERPEETAANARARLLRVTDEVLAEEAPWPSAALLWRARIARIADWFIETEQVRRDGATPVAFEVRGHMWLADLDVTLSGKADRIDRAADGSLVIYDYKTGQPPTKKQMQHFDKQLFLEAAMAEAGAFEQLEAAPVRRVAHIGLGASPEEAAHDLTPDDVAEARAGFAALVAAYLVRERGYMSRRAVETRGFDGDYDHLARHGEWDDSDPVTEILLT